MMYQNINLQVHSCGPFSILLPLIIGDLVPDEDPKWECFLLLLEIVNHCTSRVTSQKAATQNCGSSSSAS